MKIIFKWKKYFTSERSKQVKFYFREKINFIRSNQRVIFFLLHRYVIKFKKIDEKERKKQRNDISDIFTSEDMENMSFVSRMQFHMKSKSGVFYSKTLIVCNKSLYHSHKFIYWVMLTGYGFQHCRATLHLHSAAGETPCPRYNAKPIRYQ